MEIVDLLRSLFQFITNPTEPLSTLIPTSNLLFLFDETIKSLQKDKYLLHLSSDVFVVGDIHGSLDDLLRIFEKHSYPPASRYLFLGDYVDRGSHSLEVIILLFSLKVIFPDCIYLLRGNHEVENISRGYGFYDDVISSYSDFVFDCFQRVFNELSLCALISDKIFCVHGGICPNLLISDLQERKKSLDDLSLSLLWSDPRKQEQFFSPSNRGIGFYFNSKALDNFLSVNSLSFLIRAHETCQEGFSSTLKKEKTIFSATNYCGQKNSGCVAFVDSSLNILMNTFPMLKQEQIKRRRIMIPEWVCSASVSNHSLFFDIMDEIEWIDNALSF
jgi:protein phosphatase